MAKEPSIEQVLRRSLGKQAADELLAKIDRMVAKGDKAATIEKAVTADLQARFVQKVVSAVISEVGPATKVKVPGIQASVRPVVRGIVAQVPNIHRGIQATTGRRPGRAKR